MNPLIQLKNTTPLILLALVCFGFLPQMDAVLPAPDGGYPNGNTAEGADALLSITTGGANTGLGRSALIFNQTGNYSTAVGYLSLAYNESERNTAVGAAALLHCVTGTHNTGVGVDALFGQASGSSGSFNGAFGDSALFNNSDGSSNNAFGDSALLNNIDGSDNSAFGDGALLTNIHASGNTAIGDEALFSNDSSGKGTAINNTAVGDAALISNIDGADNNAFGTAALFGNISGFGNVGIGDDTLFFADASFNTGVGFATGQNVAAGSENIYIGDTAGTEDFNGNDPGDESGVIRIGSFFSGFNACFINGIAGKSIPAANAAQVLIDVTTGQLGTALVDANGNPTAAPAPHSAPLPRSGPLAPAPPRHQTMLNRKVEEQQATIGELKSTVAQQQKQMETLTAQLKSRQRKSRK